MAEMHFQDQGEKIMEAKNIEAHLFIPVTFDGKVGQDRCLDGGPANHPRPDSLKFSRRLSRTGPSFCRALQKKKLMP